MNRVIKAAPPIVLFALIIAVPSAWAYWVQDGAALCTAVNQQWAQTIVSDGAGGAIIAWEDKRLSGNDDIYIQRMNAAGSVLWTTNGVAVCAATNHQLYPQIISDGAGGAIVTWGDYRSGSGGIYAQRVDASGAIQWTANGVALCTAAGSQDTPQIVSDGTGGAIVAWHDWRSGNIDIYAQRVNASGVAQWTANGVALCTAAGSQETPQIVSDGASGAIVAWHDNRSGNYDVYAQRVNASGTVQWMTNGVALCTAAATQWFPRIAPDGAGGAIVTWYDYRSGTNYDIYAQRVNASGTVQWTANGATLCTATENQQIPMIASDGAGGAIVTWEDYRDGSGYSDIYAQRIDASGSVQWTIDGFALCSYANNQLNPTIASDGAGGAIATWNDARVQYDIYAQRVSASGAVQWTLNGVALCSVAYNQLEPVIASNGAGGAIVAWTDQRSDGGDIYAQSVDANGRVGVITPDILSVQDVPHDQGGWARITIGRAKLDDTEESAYPVSMYNVWQRIDDPALLAIIVGGNGDVVPDAAPGKASLKPFADASSASGVLVEEMNGRYFVQSKELLGAGSFPAGTWELLGSFAAYQQLQYIYLASTVADSTATDIPYSVYVVSAHTTTPSVWFASNPDSGYSVDNISPEVPGGLVAEQSYTPLGIALSWNVSAANDLARFAVYRGTSAGFVPGPANRVATPTDPEYFDGGSSWGNKYYYKISAIDVHDNQSGFALLTPDGVTGTDTPKAPEASYLSQNYPNPFNPTTRIAFGLSAPAHVSLKIYDAAGRLVRALVNEERRAARYEESWDGRDSNGRGVASGIYFYRLNAGAFESTKKMILLR